VQRSLVMLLLSLAAWGRSEGLKFSIPHLDAFMRVGREHRENVKDREVDSTDDKSMSSGSRCELPTDLKDRTYLLRFRVGSG
jgi:hypothetical protein